MLLLEIPAMPIHSEQKTAYVVYTVAMVLITGGMLLWWAFSKERRVGPGLPLLILGGAVSGLLEPLLDNIVLFWYPPEQHLPSFEAFNRTVPMFVPIGYAWFCGGLLYFVARAFDRGITRAQVWLIAAAIFVLDFVAIGATDWLGIAGFFGDPPFSVAGYPLWWGAFDVTIVLGGAAAVQLLLPRLHGAGRLYLVLVPPIVVGASTGAVGGPISIALNSSWDGTGKTLAGAATIGLGVAILHGVSVLVSQSDIPLESAGAREEPAVAASFRG